MRYFMIVMLLFAAFGTQAQGTWNTPAQSSIVKRTVQWSYGGYIFTDELTLNLSDFIYYKGLSKTQPYSVYANEQPGHPYLLQLAKALDEDAENLGYTGYTLAAYLVAFVQQAIPYQSDPYNNGYDYPRYPIETIVDEGGDCEDKAALLVALLNTFGFDAILVNTPGHMAAAMACENCGGYYNYNGKKYSFIETTASGWQIGAVPPSQYVNASLLAVSRPPQYQREENTVYSSPNYSGSGNKNFGNSWSNNRNNSGNNGARTTTINIDGVTYEIKTSGTTTITANGTIVTITRN